MRLFRRSLQCLVVGVTAFGVAGWGFRPRASWEVEVPKEANFAHNPFRTRDYPIWLTLPHDKHEWFNGSFVALAPDTGAERWTLRPPPDFVLTNDIERRADGRLLIKGQVPLLKDRTSDARTWFAIVDPKRCRCDLERTFEGYWVPVAGGDRAWMIVSTTTGFKLVIRNFSDGGVAVELPFSQGYSGFKHAAVDVSPDGKTLAICESIKDRPGDGFEIWNVEQKKLVGRYDLPAKRSNGMPMTAATPDFRDSRILWILGEKESGPRQGYERWNFDVERGEYRQDWSPEPPPSDPPLMTREQETDTYDSIWTAYDLSGGAFGWFSVFRGERQLREWRKVPYRYRTTAYITLDSSGVDVGLELDSVPGRDEFIAEVWSSPLRESLPSSLADLIGDRVDVDQGQKRFCWHHWKSNSWRDIGCPGGDVATLLREDALLCLRKTDGHSLLQSWPLPPRDPKWPALGVAALCAAGTWWMCARRYRRRMNRATISAVTT